jgi:hypothetical protein
MMVVWSIRRDLLDKVRRNLERPHKFAAERVGFLSCGAGRLPGDGLILLAANYHPVEDDDYIDDPRVGAMMGSGAIRKAMQKAYNAGAADISMFHVHMHEHNGMPSFSTIDLVEDAKFIPDFFNVAPLMPHGAIVLSHDRAAGLCWRERGANPTYIDRFNAVGAPLQNWRPA